LDQQQWRSILRQLVVLGFLFVDTAGFGALKLSEESRSLLRGEIDLPLRRDLLITRKAAKTKKKVAAVAAEDSALWEALRDCRKRLADENNVPPYVIFHDASLMEMAASKPQNEADFLAVSGVGQAKLKRYGPDFLEVVRSLAG
jgi:ATP-dependent DNA helicase RecQ